jgi:hypothetical protein
MRIICAWCADERRPAILDEKEVRRWFPGGIE